MARKKKNIDDNKYSKNDSFEKLKEVQEMALNRRGKDDEINPDISVFLKAEELKGKLYGLYAEREKSSHEVNIMGSVKIDGCELKVEIGEEINTVQDDDRIT